MRKTKSSILEAVHETAKGLNAAGAMDQVTLREFDRLCLLPPELLSPDEIKQMRDREQVSQAVFAALLNTSVSTVQKWETGQKRPAGTALKLLHLVLTHGLEYVLDTPGSEAINWSRGVVSRGRGVAAIAAVRKSRHQSSRKRSAADR